MTDDDLYARFDEITGGEELAELRAAGQKRRRGVIYHGSRFLLVALAIGGVWLVVWLFVQIVVWLGHHGLLPAPK